MSVGIKKIFFALQINMIIAFESFARISLFVDKLVN